MKSIYLIMYIGRKDKDFLKLRVKRYAKYRKKLTGKINPAQPAGFTFNIILHPIIST